MNQLKSKRIIFVGSETKLLKEWARENETEVVSSVSFLLSLGNRFIPDLIVFVKITEADIRAIRKRSELKKCTILIVQESFAELDNLNSISDFSRVIICNEQLALENEFQSSLAKMIENKRRTLSSKTALIVKYTILYINKNFYKKLSRKILADHLGVTDDYLSKIFKQEMGIPLWTYLNLIRLYVARDIIEQTETSIKQVAVQCGFESAAYFTNCFRQKFEMSPVSFRNE